MNTVITCTRCFFAFRDNFLKRKHICPSCGSVLVMRDDIEGMEHKYIFEVVEQGGLSNGAEACCDC